MERRHAEALVRQEGNVPMTDLKELKRVFLEVREKLVADSHRLMTDLSGCFEGDYDHAIDTVQRMLSVFEGLKVLSAHSESFLGALEAEDRVAEAKEKLKRQLHEFVAPLQALRKHRDALRTADLGQLQHILIEESGRHNLEIRIPDRMDPVVAGLIELFPDELGGGGPSAPGAPLREVRNVIDAGLSADKAALARALAAPDDDDDSALAAVAAATVADDAPSTDDDVVFGGGAEDDVDVVDDAVAAAAEDMFDDILTDDGSSVPKSAAGTADDDDDMPDIESILRIDDDGGVAS